MPLLVPYAVAPAPVTSAFNGRLMKIALTTMIAILGLGTVNGVQEGWGGMAILAGAMASASLSPSLIFLGWEVKHGRVRLASLGFCVLAILAIAWFGLYVISGPSPAEGASHMHVVLVPLIIFSASILLTLSLGLLGMVLRALNKSRQRTASPPAA